MSSGRARDLFFCFNDQKFDVYSRYDNVGE